MTTDQRTTRLEFTVSAGMPPKTFATRLESEWKNAVKRSFRESFGAVPFVPLDSETRFEIEIAFFRMDWIRNGKDEGPDLDNLAKPVIDAIFCSLQKYAPGQDDKNVTCLRLKKSKVDTAKEERADIVVKVIDK